MKIKTETCSAHNRMFASLQDHSSHAYRFLKVGPARRCPKNTAMSDWFNNRPPTLEELTYRETKRIRELLEEQRQQPSA